MKATERLHGLGQSLWLDNITRDLLTSGTLQRYIDDLSVTGLTSNPTIFDHAVAHSASYDGTVQRLGGLHRFVNDRHELKTGSKRRRCSSVSS